MLISGLNIYTENDILSSASLRIKNGVIEQVSSETSLDAELQFPSNYHLIPGLIDLHVHGIDGCDVMDAEQDALNKMSQALAREGTTAFLATTMTASIERIENALIAIKKYMMTQTSSGATMLGVHLEGPFISPKKMGAQCAQHILMPNVKQLMHWHELSGGHLKLVTLAPELQNSKECIAFLKQQNIIAAIGHSDATYAETLEAVQQGCGYVTHLFNAMRGLHHREPGIVTAALLAKHVWTELIVDGIHLHPAIVDLVLKIKDKEKIILITDAMRATCMANGDYELGGQQVNVHANKATLFDGTLAGSVLRMPMALQNMLQFTQCNFLDAVNMASKNPAEVLKIFNKKGSIAPGKDADLVVLDEKYNVVMTICGGRIAHLSSRNVYA